MTTTRTRLAAVLVLGMAALAGASAPAQLPSPAITNLVTGATNVLWDVSLIEGFQTNSIEVVGQTNLPVAGEYVSYSGPFTQDARGRLSGRGTNLVSFSSYYTSSNQWVQASNFISSYACSGSIVGINGVAKVNFSTRTSGQTLLDGKNRRVSASSAFQVLIYAAQGILNGSYGDIVSVTGRPTLSAGGPLGSSSIPYSQLGDGSWTLVLNTTNFPPGNRLGGAATVTLNSGAVFPFTVRGTYLSTGRLSGQSRLALVGIRTAAADGRGSTLGVSLQGNNVIGLSGHVAGQNISLK